jgi:hypothetical protein
LARVIWVVRSQPAQAELALHSLSLLPLPDPPTTVNTLKMAPPTSATAPLLRAAAVRNAVAQNARMAPRYSRQASGHGAAAAAGEVYPTEGEHLSRSSKLGVRETYTDLLHVNCSLTLFFSPCRPLYSRLSSTFAGCILLRLHALRHNITLLRILNRLQWCFLAQ